VCHDDIKRDLTHQAKAIGKVMRRKRIVYFDE
jgi:hypothetical protein